MSRAARDPDRPTLRGPTTDRPPARRTDHGSDAGTLAQLVDDGIMIGLVVAGVGFVFVLVFTVAQAVWGSYFGADPGIGQWLSGGVMTVGVAVATLLWLGRELGSAARSQLDRVRSSRRAR